MSKKVVVLLSGGMDSTTLLYHHYKAGDEVRALSIDYGQRHLRELMFAAGNARRLRVPYAHVGLSELRNVLPGSSQTDFRVAVPEGKYDEESMKQTVVPNRNMILLAIAIGHAVAHKMDFVSYAAHAGDHAIYPDCRPEFADIINTAAQKCDWHPVQLHRPFIALTKSQIVALGQSIEVPFVNTWSCYRGGHVHCGRCGTCIERREAFFLAKVSDPTSYDMAAPSIEEMVKNDWHLPKEA